MEVIWYKWLREYHYYILYIIFVKNRLKLLIYTNFSDNILATDKYMRFGIPETQPLPVAV